jgi:hypothetical protein
MAHLGALPHPVTSDVQEYACGLRDTTVHPTCTHTLPLLSSPHSEIERLGRRFRNPMEPSRIVITVDPEADLRGNYRACKGIRVEGTLLPTSCSHQRLGS